MRYLPFLAIAAFTFGCGSSETAPEEKPAAAAADPRASEKAEIRAKIDAKRKDLAQTDSDLAAIASERERVVKEPASEGKSTKLIELQRQENDTNQKKASLRSDIEDLQAQLSGQVPAKAAKAGDALDDILASNENKEKEEAERKRKKAEEEASADKARIAKAEAARQAEKDEQAKQKIEGGRIAAGADGPGFEDRWADVIQKVRAELQRYKRW